MSIRSLPLPAHRNWEDQPRNDKGEWESGGGGEEGGSGGGGLMESLENAGEEAGSGGGLKSEAATPELGMPSSKEAAKTLKEYEGGKELIAEMKAGDGSAATWAATLQPVSEAQREAVGVWESPQDYKQLQEVVRGEVAGSKEAQGVVKNIDAAIEAQKPTSAETTLYHYVSPDHAGPFLEGKAGTTVTQPGYLGATPDAGTAENFPHLAGSPMGGALLEIHAPAGTQGLVGSMHEAEQGFREVLLPHGSNLTVSGSAPDLSRTAAMSAGNPMTTVRVDLTK